MIRPKTLLRAGVALPLLLAMPTAITAMVQSANTNSNANSKAERTAKVKAHWTADSLANAQPLVMT